MSLLSDLWMAFTSIVYVGIAFTFYRIRNNAQLEAGIVPDVDAQRNQLQGKTAKPPMSLPETGRMLSFAAFRGGYLESVGLVGSCTMSRPLAKVENEDPKNVELTKLAKLEELQMSISESRARRLEADLRVAKARADIEALKASPTAK